MSVRRNSIALFLLLLVPFSAHARKVTFSTGIPFGLGFRALALSKPTTDLVVQPQDTSRSLSYGYSFEPFFDFTNFVVRGYATLYSHPLITARSGEAGQDFSESLDADSFSYGVQLLLAPLVSKKQETRGYVVLGIGQSVASLKTTRTYLDASGNATNSFLERAEGKSQELTLGVGAEFILVQNYSLQIEAGYKDLEFDRLSYESDTDVRGTQRSKGEVIRTAEGTNKKFRQTGVYGSLSFNLNF